MVAGPRDLGIPLVLTGEARIQGIQRTQTAPSGGNTIFLNPQRLEAGIFCIDQKKASFGFNTHHRMIVIGTNLSHAYNAQSFLMVVQISIKRSRSIESRSVIAEDTNSSASAHLSQVNPPEPVNHELKGYTVLVHQIELQTLTNLHVWRLRIGADNRPKF